MSNTLKLNANWEPAGDQPEAITGLVEGLNDGLAHQVLLGVTGSGKTFTMANVAMQADRPMLVMAPNKTLAAQLYDEFKALFPDNAVEFFVSYYDYYQPEAYVPSADTFIEKDSSINDHIEQMRLSATKSLRERRDTIIVASVSAIYGLGDPETYFSMALHLHEGDRIGQRDLIKRLTDMQYTRNDIRLERGTYRVRGEIIDIFPAEADKEAVRVELFDDEVERLSYFDPLTGAILHKISSRLTVYPKTHYVIAPGRLRSAVDKIKAEMQERIAWFQEQGKPLEAERIEQRTLFDLEMIREIGYCSGIENYSRYLSGRAPGEPTPCLLDYLPDDAVMVLDESHVTVPQIGGMYKGDRARKETLVEYGFRLPSALDNRPLRFNEFERIAPQMIYVSATPGPYEKEHADNTVEQVVRPTGLLDPSVEVRAATTQVDDLLSEVQDVIASKQRALVTTLTKRMAEDLTEYFHESGVAVRYLHSDIDTVERSEIIRDLRLGEFNVLVGINLLREGLDIPEVALVAILDADKEGFLRAERSLIQTIGRTARNVDGRAILYADTETGSMRRAIDETERRRAKQKAYNAAHSITPQTIRKAVGDSMREGYEEYTQEEKGKRGVEAGTEYAKMSPSKLAEEIDKLEKQMFKHAENLEFERAGELRDKIEAIRNHAFQL